MRASATVSTWRDQGRSQVAPTSRREQGDHKGRPCDFIVPAESPQPDAPVPRPPTAFVDVMALDPIVLRPRPPRHNFDDFDRHGRDDAADMMAGNPDPVDAAPRPMARDPVVTGTGRCGNDFDPRRWHDAPLDDHGRLPRPDAHPPAQPHPAPPTPPHE